MLAISLALFVVTPSSFVKTLVGVEPIEHSAIRRWPPDSAGFERDDRLFRAAGWVCDQPRDARERHQYERSECLHGCISY
jgi:hypothetical protein